MRYPLTPTQSGMLFHRLLDRTSGADVQQLVCGVEHLDALQRAVDRHDVLRTWFAWEGLPAPLQEIAPVAEVPVAQHAELETYLREDRARGFELDRPPLMRF